MTPRNAVILSISLAVLAALIGTDIWLRLRPPAPSHSASTSASRNEEPLSSTVKLDADAQRNVGLATKAAQIRSVVETLQVTGSVGPNETRVAHIRPLTRGRILDVKATLGDTVSAGQTLAVYDNIELGELLGQYSVGLAALDKANADADAARRSHDRARNLVALGAVAQAELERRAAEVAGATAAINTQRAELARIEEKMHRYGLSDADIRRAVEESREHREVSRTTVTAPIAGIVTKYDVAEGEVVGEDREIFTVADLSTVWVQADVFEKDIALVQKGLTVKVSVDAFPGEIFQGRITYINDVLDPKTRTTKVRCEVANPSGRLRVDMFATIAIPAMQGRSAVMVPGTAIQQVDDQPVVFVVISLTEFQRRNVQAGTRDGDWVEITNGVQKDERVVTSGSFDLKSLLLRERIGERE